MTPKIQRLRRSAFKSQAGKCWYCTVRMWQQSPAELATAIQRSADDLKCTAEHLQARRDGGLDVPTNIVAACWRCNHGRHRLKPAPEPEAYRRLIEKQVRNGCWHKSWVRVAGLLTPLSCPVEKTKKGVDRDQRPINVGGKTNVRPRESAG